MTEQELNLIPPVHFLSLYAYDWSTEIRWAAHAKEHLILSDGSVFFLKKLNILKVSTDDLS